MIRHPLQELFPYDMINVNNNGNYERLLRHPPPHPPPPPPPGTVEIGSHNNPHRHLPMPIYSVRGARMFASQQIRIQVNTNRISQILHSRWHGQVRADGRPFSSQRPSDLIPPNPHYQQDADYDSMETDDEDEPNPVNFVLCKERFNGTGDVRPFINAILDFKYCSEMTDESALRSFSLLLTDHAADWWKANKTFVTDWNTALKQLRNAFRARTPQHSVYYSFFNAAQNEEATAEFVQRKQTLLNIIPVNTLTQETQLDMIFAMLHRRIKDKVNRDDCNTLTDLVERARLVEVSTATQETAPPQESSKAQEPVAEEPMLPEEPPVELEAAPKQKAALETPASPNAQATLVPSSSSLASIPISDSNEPLKAPCDRCRIYDLLFERTCNKLHKGKKSTQSTALLEELRKLDAEQFHKVVCFRCRSDNIVDLKCQKCTHEIAGGCPLISVSIFEMKFNFAVDTGSSHSVASSQLIDHLVACGQEFAFDALIMPIGGVPMRQVFRVAKVVVMVAGVKIPTVLVDLPGATKSVFGMDFIKEAGLVMDFRGEGTWTVRGGDREQPVFYGRLNPLGSQN